MQLDRNKNPDGKGKYALVHLRRLTDPSQEKPGDAAFECAKAIRVLRDHGVLTLGSESPEDQFFVMKYGDRFTTSGLMGYASGVRLQIQMLMDRRTKAKSSLEGPELALEVNSIESQIKELLEYALQIEREAFCASPGNKIPD